MDDVEPVPFLAARFGLAAVALAPFVVRGRAPGLFRAGAVAGVCLGAGYVLQTIGLQYTTTSVSALLTYLLVIVVPVLSAALLRTRTAPRTWAGIAVAVVGLLLLTGGNADGGLGEFLTILCAVAFAAHVVAVAAFAPRFDVLAFTGVQMAVVAGALLLPALGQLDLTAGAWGAAAYTGLVVNIAGFGLMVWGQRHVSASRAALVLMLEPVFATVLGYVDGERFGVAAGVGAVLILTGIAISEVRRDS